ncbi:LPP20 family lipoprotein [Spongiibacter marinus]|uniref:LPP20 family lipoprotein n=1 Tax=Spongiibacter marinus TaxID=354246 RepID=UPI0004879323|nr:LPP20 family lipoprotein [Spongiibacter marinus]
MKKKIIGVTCAVLMTACASTEQAADTQQSQQGAGGLPQWVMNPYIDDGFASAQCVPYSSNMSIDRQLAVANARTDLAQQLETKVAVLDKVFRERTDVSSGVSSGSTFSSVAKQLTQQTLIGTRAERVEFVEIDGKKNLCVLVTMGRDKTLALFDNMLAASERQVQPDTREVLLQQFKGAQAQQELNKEMAR